MPVSGATRNEVAEATRRKRKVTYAKGQQEDAYPGAAEQPRGKDVHHASSREGAMHKTRQRNAKRQIETETEKGKMQSKQVKGGADVSKLVWMKSADQTAYLRLQEEH